RGRHQELEEGALVGGDLHHGAIAEARGLFLESAEDVVVRGAVGEDVGVEGFVDGDELGHGRLREGSERQYHDRMSQTPKPPAEVIRYYEETDEAGRLEVEYFPLERARTQEIVTRHLPPPPAVVLDVGGAAGAYAYWLAARGDEVHLVDPVPRHV